jgi:hypothetical protein
MIGTNTYAGNVVSFNTKPNSKHQGQTILEIIIKCSVWNRGRTLNRFIKASILDKRSETYVPFLAPGIPVCFTGYDEPWATIRKKDTDTAKAGEAMILYNVQVDQFEFLDYPGRIQKTTKLSSDTSEQDPPHHSLPDDHQDQID